MSDFDGEAGQYENVKNEHYCMQKSWEARNNKDMNVKMGYGNMADLANTPFPPTQMEGPKNNRQLGPEAADNDYNYNADR